MPAVDPDGRQAEPLGRDVVVVQALGDVEDAVARQPEPLEREFEVPLARLVAPGLLGGHDPVEVGAEASRRPGEQVVVAIGDDAEAEPSMEAGEGSRRIGEGRPLADRIGEGRDLVRVRVEAKVGADATDPGGEDRPIVR